MSVLPILTIPHPALYRPCAKIERIDEQIRTLAADMIAAMKSHPHCVGIAAPQVGKNIRLVVIDVSLYPKPHPNRGEMTLINPVLRPFGEKRIGREGCLSVPDLTGNVLRSEKVDVEALNLDGNIIKFETSGFEAVVVQHEVDHLDGILFLDRVASLKTDVFRRK